MNPVSPVIPNEKFKETIIAEKQEEYGNLPSIKLADGVILSRWELSDEEKAFVAEHGYVYVRIWTFGRPINPLRIDAEEPDPSELPDAQAAFKARSVKKVKTAPFKITEWRKKFENAKTDQQRQELKRKLAIIALGGVYDSFHEST